MKVTEFTMDPKDLCDNIIHAVKTSNLNYSLQESPFSVYLSIKKTFIQNKHGDLLLPKYYGNIVEETKQLRAEFENIKSERDALVLDTSELHTELEKSRTHVQELMEKSEQQQYARELLEQKLVVEHIEQVTLKQSSKDLKHNSETLKLEINALKKNLKSTEKEVLRLKAKSDNLEDNRNSEKTEIASLKQDKNKNEKENIRLKRQLQSLKKPETSSSSTNTPLHSMVTKATSPTYVSTMEQSTQTNTGQFSQATKSTSTYLLPETSTSDSSFALRSSLISSTSSAISSQRNMSSCPSSSQHSKTSQPFTPIGFGELREQIHHKSPDVRVCMHETQCVARQPFSPPLPAMIPLVNQNSDYHVKIQSGSLDWGSTCSYCMRIDYERYGCNSCVWLKTFGELHGFPDIDPCDFNKYLVEN